MKSLSAVVVSLVILCFASRCYAQTELVSDDFAGTNGTPLGSNWTGCGFSNGAYTELVYENNAAGGSGYYAQDCSLYTGYGVFPSDQYATATVVAPTPSSILQASIQLRANATPSTNEAYIACGWDAKDFAADYHYRIWSLAPGGAGPVSLWLGTITPATNDVISCQVLGNIVTMQVNGQPVASVTDTSGINSGYPGLYYNDPSGTGPSLTDVIFADFQAGSGPSVVSSEITPSSATVPAGSFVQYSGTITYADGTIATMNNWSSSDTTVATIDVTGTAYGVGPGTAMLTGSSGPDSVTGTMNVVAPNGYTPQVYDTFVGSGGGYLGSNWTGCGNDSGAYNELVYENNTAGGSGYYARDCALYTGMGSFPNDQYATALIVNASPSSIQKASLELRGNASPSTPEGYIACGWDAQDFASDQHYRIWSLAPNGAPTSLYLSTVTPATNDVIWCQVLGNEVTMQVNGTTIAVVTDTSGLTSGYPGLFYSDPNGGAPETSDVIFDNFAAGSVNNPVLASIAVSPNPATTEVDSSVQLAASGTYTDGTTANVTNSVSWSSSDASVATVNESGLASGVGSGTATITATNGTVSGMASLTVNSGPAAMTIPTPGNTLSGASTTFQWTPGAGATGYFLWIGTTPGGYDLANLGEFTTTSTTVTLPTTGATIYVRLWSVINGTPSQYADYTYTEASVVPAAMSSPMSGSTLTGSSTTFNWTAGSGVTGYFLWIGTTPGGYDLANLGEFTTTSATVTVPTTGATIYVRLWSVINGRASQYADYTYTEASVVPAAMSSPMSGSTLTGSSTTFNWTAGSGVTGYFLWIGTTPGAHDLANLGEFTTTSTTVTLPTIGATIYVRLWSVINGTPSQYADYTYTEASVVPAAMSSPMSGSTLTGSSTTFNWTAGSGVTGYFLWIGTTPGGYDLANLGEFTTTSTTVTLPTTGATIYVRLWSVINGRASQYGDYTYTEATQ